MRICSKCHREFNEPHQFKLCNKCREYNRGWNKRNPAYMHRWYEENIEKVHQRSNQGYQENRERRLEQTPEWYHENKDKRLALNDQWKDTHPEKVLAHQHNYRARRRNAEGSFTDAELKQLGQLQEGLCFYCGKPFFNGNLRYDRHIEHKMPLSRGGSNDISNIALSCSKCNYEKSTKTHEEFLAYQQKFL